MNIRSSLFAKILAWFFINLVLVGGLIWVVYKFQIGPGSPFVGQSEERIRQVAGDISDKLIETPREEWDRVLQRATKRRQITFYLCSTNGAPLAGDQLDLPQEVLERMQPPNIRRPNPMQEYLNRFVVRRYADLNATEVQIQGIVAAWRGFNSNRTDLERKMREDGLSPEERQSERNVGIGKFAEQLQEQIKKLLSPNQVPVYEQIIRRGLLSFSLGPPRNFVPRMSDQQLTRIIQQADQDNDNALNITELRTFVRNTPNNAPGNRFSRLQIPRNLPPPLGQRVFTHTSRNPTHYWAGVEIPVRIQDDNATEPPSDVAGLRPVRRQRENATYFLASLVIRSDSLGGAGLFTDPLPWISIVIVALVLSALFWLPMVRNITQPIAEVTAATERIAEGKFETRVGTARGDEIGRVGQAVDHMADRLAGFVKGQKRFLGDISHELCSPIARIQAALANLEQRADDSQKKYVTDLSEEVEHMSELVDELLMFSKAGMKTAEVKLEPVRLDEVVQRVIDREGAAATNLNVDIDDGMAATADSKLLSRALGNLVRNAIRYAGQAGPIELKAEREEDLIKITIADQGPGLPSEILPHIFDPFSRPEEARSRDTGGVGLGLSIVKSCVEACGGTIICRNRKPNGLEFSVTLQSA